MLETNLHHDAEPLSRALPPEQVLFGSSAAAMELIARLEAVAPTDLPIVLQGEAGTGKEVAARWIHARSSFADERFIKASCINLEGEEDCRLVLDERDIHARGSLLEQLRALGNGTLFLDDVENLALTTQALLSRLLQESMQLGADVGDRLPLRFRIISATRNDLKRDTSHRLRPEFFHTISAFTARLAPLRERRGDLPMLTDYFIDLHSHELGLERPSLSSGALATLGGYTWPGNFHELEQMLISYVLTGSEEFLVEKIRAVRRSPEIDAVLEATAELPPPAVLQDVAVAAAATAPVRATRASRTSAIADEEILRALRENRWNRRQAALRLQMSYRSLLNRLKKIDSERAPQGSLRWAHGRLNG